MKVRVETQRDEDDESIENGDPRGAVGDRTERVDRAEDFDREDAEEAQVDPGNGT